jgi:RNase P subunit RPR2
VRVFCAECHKFMGEVEITGKLRKGYAALSVYIECSDCQEPDRTSTKTDDFTIEKLMGLFGMKK